MEKNKYLIVLRILEGRGFSKKINSKIVVEAQFDGEHLLTDALEHVECPFINQELAWEIDKKQLSHHKLHKTPIKLQVFSIENSAKEFLGYVILDIRMALKPMSTWHFLLQSKYNKIRPEICLYLYLESLDNTANNSPILQRKPSSTRHLPQYDIASLKPILVEEDSCYRIGPESSTNEKFELSVAITSASNLNHLIPANITLPDDAGFYFDYSLLGNEIATPPFYNILEPKFEVDRAKVIIKSNILIMRKFFTDQPGLEVHLCCGNYYFGLAIVPLKNLLKPDSSEIYMKPVTISDNYKLISTIGNKLLCKSEEEPIVHILIQLKIIQTKSSKSKPVESCGSSRSKNSVELESLNSEIDNVKNNEAANGVESITAKDFPMKNNLVSNLHTQSEHMEDIKSNVPIALKLENNKNDFHINDPKKNISSVINNKKVKTFEDNHHYTFSIIIINMYGFANSMPLNISIKYSYPFFGSKSPNICNNILIEEKRGEVQLPNSPFSFDFATSVKVLQKTFEKAPLIIEIWSSDKSDINECIGVVNVPLNAILKSDQVKSKHSSGVMGWKKMIKEKYPINSLNGSGSQIGHMMVEISYEDWGPVESFQPEDSANVEPLNIRNTLEYCMAKELEIWKLEQQKLFEIRLAEKEKNLLNTCEEKFKNKERQREIASAQEKAELLKYKAELRKTLTELEKREKVLASKEFELVQLRKDLKLEHERMLTELKEASRRHADECNHKVQYEMSKVKDLEEIIGKLKRRIQEEERRYDKIMKDFDNYKESQLQKPQLKLQGDYNNLMTEKINLEKKIDNINKSKLHYKNEWLKAIKLITSYKELDAKRTQDEIFKTRLELEDYKVKKILDQEREASKKESQALDDVKKQLQMIKVHELQSQAMRMHNNPSVNSTDFRKIHDNRSSPDSLLSKKDEVISSNEENDDYQNDIEEDGANVIKLIEERDLLLKTGVYTCEDPLISNIDSKIRQMLSLIGRS